MLKIAICDDENHIRLYLENRLRESLAKLDASAFIQIFKSGEELLLCYENTIKPFDIILLDIKMDKTDGIETAKAIRNYDDDVLIIFITSSAEHVFLGYEVKAFRYILKSELEYSFDRVLKEAISQITNTQEPSYTFSFGSSTISLPVSEILYCESRKRLLIIVTGKEEYKTYEKMDNAENVLAKFDFVRCHQSFIVNIKHIREWNSKEIILKNDKNIPISKRYQKNISDAVLWSLR